MIVLPRSPQPAVAQLRLVRPMRSPLVVSVAAMLVLVGCAQPQSAAPAAQPIIEGKVNAVSSADIQAALDAFYRRYRHSGSPPPPSPIRVMIVDHNHIAIHFHTIGPTEQYEIIERTSSGWGAFRTAVTGAPPSR